MKHSGRLFVVSAPSGAGKTTLVEAVLKKLGTRYDLVRIVTYTSRTPRQGEREGKDYYYLSTQDFAAKIEEGFFIEWSNGLGHYYGTQKALMKDLEQGRSGILVIDRAGAAQVLNHIPEAILVWIEVSDSAVLEQRLVHRGTETRAQIQQRVLRAYSEIEEEREKMMYHHHICNDIFDDAVEKLETIIITALRR